MLAKLERRDDGKLVLCCPAVGLWREMPARRSLVYAGAALGRLEVLGVLHPVRAPEGAHGLVIELGGDEARARRPMGFGDVLAVLDPQIGALDVAEEDAASSLGGELVFRAPSSGRFYARPSPDKDPFVEAGDTIQQGQTVAILEVMKTFNRVKYGGDGLPSPARVVRIVPADGDDLAAGDPLLELETA